MKKEVQKCQKEMLEGERTCASQPARHPVDVTGKFFFGFVFVCLGCVFLARKKKTVFGSCVAPRCCKQVTATCVCVCVCVCAWRPVAVSGKFTNTLTKRGLASLFWRRMIVCAGRLAS